MAAANLFEGNLCHTVPTEYVQPCPAEYPFCNACDTTSWYVIDFKRTLNFDEAPEERRLLRTALQDQYRRGQVMGLAHAAHATQC